MIPSDVKRLGPEILRAGAKLENGSENRGEIFSIVLGTQGLVPSPPNSPYSQVSTVPTVFLMPESPWIRKLPSLSLI